MKLPDLDQDAVVACVDLVARTGAKSFEVGYLDDDVPLEQARWYAQAFLRGARIVAQEKEGPDEACDALARRILRGGRCNHCQKTVALSGTQGVMCVWYRDRDAWVQGCTGKRRATRDKD